MRDTGNEIDVRNINPLSERKKLCCDEDLTLHTSVSLSTVFYRNHPQVDKKTSRQSGGTFF